MDDTAAIDERKWWVMLAFDTGGLQSHPHPSQLEMLIPHPLEIEWRSRAVLIGHIDAQYNQS
jgi:hypothetical protein